VGQTPVATSELKIETETNGDETLVRCIGKMRHPGSEALRNIMAELLPESKRIVIDLGELTFLDSFGLGVLVSVYLSARRQDRALKLINVNPQAQQLLRLTNLTYLIAQSD
jgi:anti-anti-sigma factor